MTKIMYKVNNLCKLIQTLAEPALEQMVKSILKPYYFLYPLSCVLDQTTKVGHIPRLDLCKVILPLVNCHQAVEVCSMQRQA